MDFIDEVHIDVSAGDGGDGCLSFKRAKNLPKGGPDGGDGGSGGDIVFRTNAGLNTLARFRYEKSFSAESGKRGLSNNKSGADGKDLVIEVPVGTIIYDESFKDRVADLSKDNQEFVVAKGGKGGFGNLRFKSSTNRSPRKITQGKEGGSLSLRLELRLLADVGLLGKPNSGKSSLVKAVSSANPKIADYEFTTLKPNLGIVAMSDFRSFVMADIPGIIEGASEGRGLGHYFLRHIERNSILLYVIPVDTKNIKKDFTVLQKELIKYNPELADKDFIIAFSKADLMDQELLEEFKTILKQEFKEIQYHIISSVSTFGINELKEDLWNKLNQKN